MQANNTLTSLKLHMKETISNAVPTSGEESSVIFVHKALH